MLSWIITVIIITPNEERNRRTFSEKVVQGTMSSFTKREYSEHETQGSWKVY